MSLSITDLFTPQSKGDIRASMVTNLVALGIPADKWRSGGVASSVLTIMAMALALLSQTIATLIQGFFLPTATGVSLKLLATYLYGVTIPSATFATGSVTLTNSGGGSYTLQPGQLIVQNSTTKATYHNDAVVIVAPSSTVTGVTVIANVEGSAGNAVPAAIDTMVTALLGVTVTNPTSLVGVDAPTDEGIRTLCLNKLGALSVRGVRTAYAYAVQTALNAVTGAPVNVNRWSISGSSSTGTVTVVVAAPSGAPDPNDVQGVADNIEAIARPEAVTAVVSGATTAAYTRTITIWCKVPTGVSSADVDTAVSDALLGFISTYPIGGVTANDDANPSTPFTGLFGVAIEGAIAIAVAALGGQLLSAQGATDLALTSTQVATDGITLSVRLIAPTSGTTVS